jgi:hypothetical protein
MIGTFCKIAIEISSQNHVNSLEESLLIIDCYFLYAVSLYRLHKPIEAVLQFNLGKRV